MSKCIIDDSAKINRLFHSPQVFWKFFLAANGISNKERKRSLCFVPEPLELLFVISPVFVNLDEKFQEDLLSSELLNISSGLHAEFLDGDTHNY